ncbi:MAG: hypothetical protein HQK66_15420, partial [Desulfamplus sp.]|nr:hypothetical protein [Desulfamplus sp.]
MDKNMLSSSKESKSLSFEGQDAVDDQNSIHTPGAFDDQDITMPNGWKNDSWKNDINFGTHGESGYARSKKLQISAIFLGLFSIGAFVLFFNLFFQSHKDLEPLAPKGGLTAGGARNSLEPLVAQRGMPGKENHQGEKN